jgi:hypothetical protein
MTFVRFVSFACVFALLVSSAPVLLGQDAAQERGKTGARGQETTVTGCLNKGSGDAQYMLTDSKSGTEMTVTGTTDLEKHSSNHTVKLTGTKSTEGGKTTFTVTKVEHVSPTCQAPAKK